MRKFTLVPPIASFHENEMNSIGSSKNWFAGIILFLQFATLHSQACQCPPPYVFVTDTISEGHFRVKKFLLDSLFETSDFTEADLVLQLRKDFESSQRVLHVRLESSFVVTGSGNLLESLDPKYVSQPDSVGLKVRAVLRGIHAGDTLWTKWGGDQCDFGNYGHLKGLEFFAQHSGAKWLPSIWPMEGCDSLEFIGTSIKGGRIFHSGFGEVSISLSDFETEVLSTVHGELKKSTGPGRVTVSGNRISRLIHGIVQVFDWTGRRIPHE
jgi:hypothetical protein